MTLYIGCRLKVKGQPLVGLGLVHGLALPPGKARGIGQACVLGVRRLWRCPEPLLFAHGRVCPHI